MKLEKHYFPTHIHTDVSNFRLKDSINKVTQVIDYSLEIGLPGVSITDHDALSNHVKAYSHLEKLKKNINKKDKKGNYIYDKEERDRVNDFKLCLGNEIYLVENGVSASTKQDKATPYYHFILLAKDEIGHEQIRLLSSRAWIRSFYDRGMERVPTYKLDIEEVIGENKGHVVATTACLGGYLAYHYKQFRESGDLVHMRKAKEFCDWCVDIFGDDFYIELQPTKMSKDQIYFNSFAYEFAKDMGIQPILATDAHYLTENERDVHEAYLNSEEGKEREVAEFYSSTYLMTTREIYEHMDPFFDRDKTREMLDNTLAIRDKIEDYSLYSDIAIPKIDIPDFTLEVPEPYLSLEYINIYYNSAYPADRYLLYEASRGIERKKHTEEDKKKSWERINLEMKELYLLSEKVGVPLSDYLVTIQKIVNIIWDDGDSLIAPSRGSAMGFELCYLLGITQISPIDKEIPLPFWRFISSERVSMPE